MIAPKILVTRKQKEIESVELWLDGELPTLRKSDGMNFKTHKTNPVGRYLILKQKQNIQRNWYTKIVALGAHKLIAELQRENAARKVLTDISVIVYRRRELDLKNLLTAIDELLLDPLQRATPPVIFNDKPSNINLHFWQEKVSKEFCEVNDGECYVYLRFARSDHPCGRTTVDRYKAELKGAKQ